MWFNLKHLHLITSLESNTNHGFVFAENYVSVYNSTEFIKLNLTISTGKQLLFSLTV